MVQWIKEINIVIAFVVLLAFHGLLYRWFGTASWFAVSLMASAVDTAVLALLQRLLPSRSEHR